MHEKTHTGIESRLTHPCTNCSKKFSSSQIASRHFKTCGKPKIEKEKKARETLCHICQKEFSSIYKLNTHLKIHEGKLDFQCKVCFKKFASRFALNKHSLIHEKRFQCEICEKMFSRKDNLETHIKFHFKVKSAVDVSSNLIVEYICSFCNQTFTSKDDLMNHFETDSVCHKNCQEQLYQEVIEYTEGADQLSIEQNAMESEIIFTQVVEAEDVSSKVFAEVVDKDSEIILVDNAINQEVLIIEEPVVYI